ncbi:ribonucleoside-diphosphate reductase alpha chain [Gammaproteobacteria bacterium]
MVISDTNTNSTTNSKTQTMKILKRNGQYQELSFDKVLYRMRKLTNDLSLGLLSNIESDIVAQKVIHQIYDGVSSAKLDELAAQIAIGMSIEHIEYGELASRIIISNMHKNTSECFSDVMEDIANKNSMIKPSLLEIIRKNKDKLNFCLDYSRDFLFDYFGFKTLERSYLQKTESGIIERPQHMLLRVSLGIHKDDIDAAIETYNLMSRKYFIHASPTLFNAGTNTEQLSSCFLVSTDDSMINIYKTISDCAIISKNAGGIGLAISNIRAKGSIIKGTGGQSDGIVPMLKVYNETARYCNQGSRRKGSFAIYLEPWHADVFAFLELRKNNGDENSRARDLFYALYIPDLFMQKVEEDGDWYLMCPDKCPGLQDAYGDKFVLLYQKYIDENKFNEKIKARDLWQKILISQIETGMPYMVYKDAINSKTNQQNLGTLKLSNLCAEVAIYSDFKDEEIGVCNIATLGLPMYLKEDNTFDFELLEKVARVATRNLNRVIDTNYYPVYQTSNSNTRHRPIIVGIQGLYDVFMRMRIPYASKEASVLNSKIMEVIYYACLSESNALAQKDGSYSSFKGSPMSKGLFQFDLWGVHDTSTLFLKDKWEKLRSDIMESGLRNSLVTALPPTASTSQILGNIESFEPITSNVFMRNTLSGTFPVINKYLMKDLIKIGLWNDNMKNKLMEQDGSIQNIPEIPTEYKELYKTIWEIPQKILIDLSADRGKFVDHSQSLNIFIASPNYAKLSSMHMYGWKKGLKTGMYYLRSKPASRAIQFTVNANANTSNANAVEEAIACSLANPESCESCSG